ncbi:MAG: hypothetical protein AAGF12_04120 [Myxococcota bacterium]
MRGPIVIGGLLLCLSSRAFAQTGAADEPPDPGRDGAPEDGEATPSERPREDTPPDVSSAEGPSNDASRLDPGTEDTVPRSSDPVSDDADDEDTADSTSSPTPYRSELLPSSDTSSNDPLRPPRSTTEGDREEGPTHAPIEDADADFEAFFVALSGHLSLLGDLVDRSTLLIRGGYGLYGGYRFGDFGVFAEIEHDLWVATEVELEVELGVLNLAGGFEFFYFDRRVRASVALGAAVLLAEQPFNGAGTTGIFFELRPVGLRWPIGEQWTFQVDPLTFAVEAPVLSTPTLVDIEYRTVLTLEWEGR